MAFRLPFSISTMVVSNKMATIYPDEIKRLTMNIFYDHLDVSNMLDVSKNILDEFDQYDKDDFIQYIN